MTNREAKINILAPILLILTTVLISGCVTGAGDIVKTLQLSLNSPEVAPPDASNTGLSYLRLVKAGKVIYLVKGSIEQNSFGNIEVWYSSIGEVLRTQNGRIITTTGLASDWTTTNYSPAPNWQSILSNQITVNRIHDEMPGYKFNITEAVTLKTIPTPTKHHLLGFDAGKLIWIEERAKASNQPWRYALIPETAEVVYSEQCFQPDQCMAWQSWPPKTNRDSLLTN